MNKFAIVIFCILLIGCENNSSSNNYKSNWQAIKDNIHISRINTLIWKYNHEMKNAIKMDNKTTVDYYEKEINALNDEKEYYIDRNKRNIFIEFLKILALYPTVTLISIIVLFIILIKIILYKKYKI